MKTVCICSVVDIIVLFIIMVVSIGFLVH